VSMDEETTKTIERGHDKLAYSIPEAARLIGVSASHLYHLSAAGQLPVAKIGTRCVILAEDFRAWLRRHRRGGAQ